MEKNEIKKLLKDLYLETLNVYPVKVRKRLQEKIFEINQSLGN